MECNSASLWISLTIIASLILAGSQQQYGGQQQQQQQQYRCPENNGRFADPQQCDAYVECSGGVGTRKLCPDGLLFSETASIFSYPCLYPQEVNCLGRSSLQPAQPNGDCPHQFGYYRWGDETHCGQFLQCSNGHGHIFDCPEGLAFNEQTIRCDWPDQVPSCNAEAYLGFTCPDPINTAYGPDGYLFFRSPSNCQKYFLCIKGRPRLLSCSEGDAFNELINACDGAENVTGCAVPPTLPSQNFNYPDQQLNYFNGRK